MCGIIGYYGSKNGIDIVLNGLRKLEYRGYDSWGVAIKEKGAITITKDIGKISEAPKFKAPGNLAIGHTRWSTHGAVTVENSHPHSSNNNKISVVHNGIIENYQEIRKRLIKEGFKFKSETDTEVIPILIEYHMRNEEFKDACKTAFRELEGGYAIVAIYADEDKIVAARKGSPLVVGIGQNGVFVASDIPAFLEHTKKVIYLEDYDIVEINKTVSIFNLEDNLYVNREAKTIEWDAEQAKKGDFEHFMLKEITEQAETVKRAVTQDQVAIEKMSQQIKKAQDVVFVACGSSYHACLCGKYLFSEVAKKNVSVVLGSEFPNQSDFINKDSLIIAVSQSGETADVLEAVKVAKKKGGKVISIVNVMGSSLHRESDHTILMQSGPEICVLSTKTYTSQLAILMLLAYAMDGRFNTGRDRLKELIMFIYYMTSANTRDFLKSLAERLRYTDHLFTIGRGLQYPTALEAALKIKEVSYIHAEGFAGGELKHGTIALIEHGTPCIVFVSKENKQEIISNAIEIKSRGGFIIGIAEDNNEAFDFFIKVRDSDVGNSICQIIPIQILAYQLALLRGHDPDKPRNLAKSVTVK
jgi:glutamine---fructose-6-phosphate transaminase (isomerizing)